MVRYLFQSKEQRQQQEELAGELRKKTDVLESVPVPVMMIDRDFNVTYMNRQGATAVSRTQEQTIGLKCYNLFNTEDCRTESCKLHQAMNRDGTFTGETVADINGTRIPIQYTGSPVKDEEGDIIGAVEYVLDKTEEKRILDDASTKVSYLNNVPTPVRAIDTDFTVKFMNNAGAQVAGLEPEACIGKKCYDLFTNPHCKTGECRTAKAMKNNGIFTGETSVSARGLNLPIRYTGAPLHDDHGNIIGGLEYVADMTEVKSVVTELNRTAQNLKQGDLRSRAEIEGAEGDYKLLIDAFNGAVENILDPVNEAVGVLKSMSDGDLSQRVMGEYEGDHAVVKDSLNSTLDVLNDILEQVSVAAQQVSSGAAQVSDSSQTLSEGATEQASSLEEITSSMTEMGSQTKQNAENAGQANALSNEAAKGAREGNEQMKQMLAAMGEINQASGEISKIIKTIDEIAFQTNLLALNAAVEAARAGVHGKGFAVVAEEVRNLAQRSAKAAKETTAMIEGSIQKAERGSSIAEATASALEHIVGGITKVSDLIAEIDSASREQATGIDQVSDSLQQIDQVTQSNSSSAEESAAASEELSGQAQQLRSMLARFTLSGTTQSNQRRALLSGNGHDGNGHARPASRQGWDSMNYRDTDSKGHHGNGTRRVEPREDELRIELDSRDFGEY
ncbi:PAS domain-containing protein [bacterium]|nr:PAS domain-containing protein [bacterium]